MLGVRMDSVLLEPKPQIPTCLSLIHGHPFSLAFPPTVCASLFPQHRVPRTESQSTCSSCRRDSPPLQKSSARKPGVEGPGMSAKLRGAEPEPLEPSEAPSLETQRARCNTLEVSLRVWVMVWFGRYSTC